MLAERLPGLLPPLDEQAALEVTAIHSVAGTLPPGAPLVTRPTFEAPHHSATMAALIGGGSGQIRPGALCRAHACESEPFPVTARAGR
jgi:magnesium chelatase family protein